MCPWVDAWIMSVSVGSLASIDNSFFAPVCVTCL